MTHDGRLLLRAVLANPDEDAPRAALADYLQEQPGKFHQWYGRFVAEQLAGTPAEAKMWSATVLGLAAEELPCYTLCVYPVPNVFAHGVNYGGGQAPNYKSSSSAARSGDPVFSVNRGFVCRAELTCADFMKCAAPLFARHPVTSVRLTDKVPDVTPEGWHWHRAIASREPHPDVILSEIFTLMPVCDGAGNDLADECKGYAYRTLPWSPLSPTGLRYLTPDRALTALDRAAVLYGRKAAAAWSAENSP